MKDPEFDKEAARYDAPIASRRFILETMSSAGEPMAFKRLAKELELEERLQRDALKNRLRAMVRDGQLVVDRRNVYAIASRMELVRGRISGHVDGYGFLIPEDAGEDVFLGHRQMRGAFHGDAALVRIRGRDRRGRPEGEIVEVLERKTDQLVGRVYFENQTWLLESLNNRICQEIMVRDDDDSDRLVEGQIVVARIVDQPSMHGMPSCQVEEVLGEHLTVDMEIKVSLRNHDIPAEFSDEVKLDVEAMPEEVDPDDKTDRADLTELPFVTIDGADARDFDDAIYCETRDRGGYRLLVAIADVAHYVRKGTLLDEAASDRGTSVYFPQFVVPMLPSRLSNGLCSLRPNVDRLVLVCEMLISANGRISSYQFYEGVIRSVARLTYDQVAGGDEDKGRHGPSLASAAELLKVLLSRRAKRGALDFDSAELAFDTDNTGAIVAVARRQRNDAHRMIEECMLCANVCAARFMDHLGREGLYRVHERPDEERVKNLRGFLESVGIGLPEGLLTPMDFQQALADLRAKPNGHILQIAVLRALSQAVYQVKNAGHFGLNYPMYTHFTSPIRRYPDLLTHRLLKSVIHGKTETDRVRRFGSRGDPHGHVDQYGYDSEELRELGDLCSYTERRAETAVYEVVEWMKCEYAAGKVGDIEPGVVTGVTSFGLFVELSAVSVEGLVHVSSLVDDYYQFDQVSQCLVGENSGLRFGIGDNVTAQVVRVNVDERKVDLELISHHPIKRKRQRQRPEARRHRGQRRRGPKRRRY